MPKTQDPMTLIHELVMTLNLYVNAGVDLKSSLSRNSNPKFVPTTSSSVVHPTLSKVKVNKEVVSTSRRTRLDLSESKPKNPNQSGSEKNHKPQ